MTVCCRHMDSSSAIEKKRKKSRTIASVCMCVCLRVGEIKLEMGIEGPFVFRISAQRIDSLGAVCMSGY